MLTKFLKLFLFIDLLNNISDLLLSQVLKHKVYTYMEQRHETLKTTMLQIKFLVLKSLFFPISFLYTYTNSQLMYTNMHAYTHLYTLEHTHTHTHTHTHLSFLLPSLSECSVVELGTVITDKVKPSKLALECIQSGLRIITL